nr:hypothetical protein [uncultured Methanoregula sp.]
MTPAEFNEYYEAKVKDRKDLLELKDTLNALQCLIAARCGGSKDSRLSDFFLFKERIPEKPQTDDEFNQACDLWVIATGGHRKVG